MLGKVHTPVGLLEVIANSIGVKQRWPLSSTLFHLYKDDISNYIERLGGPGAWSTRVDILILQYTNDFFLTFWRAYKDV